MLKCVLKKWLKVCALRADSTLSSGMLHVGWGTWLPDTLLHPSKDNRKRGRHRRKIEKKAPIFAIIVIGWLPKIISWAFKRCEIFSVVKSFLNQMFPKTNKLSVTEWVINLFLQLAHLRVFQSYFSCHGHIFIYIVWGLDYNNYARTNRVKGWLFLSSQRNNSVI